MLAGQTDQSYAGVLEPSKALRGTEVRFQIQDQQKNLGCIISSEDCLTLSGTTKSEQKVALHSRIHFKLLFHSLILLPGYFSRAKKAASVAVTFGVCPHNSNAGLTSAQRLPSKLSTGLKAHDQLQVVCDTKCPSSSSRMLQVGSENLCFSMGPRRVQEICWDVDAFPAKRIISPWEMAMT